jgi:hypothetical protein
MPFKVTVGGQVLTTEDLTLDEIEVVEADAGESWLFIVQAPAKSARHAKAVLTAVLRHGGMDAAEASKVAGALTLREVLDCFELVDDDRPTEHVDGVPVVDPPVAAEGSETT